jgi:histidine triad (HIT) family protein
MSECIFCDIAAHELPATILREDDEVLAIRDVNPQAPIHVLVLPREHIVSVA